MQGTIATFDPDSRSGTLLLDDGSELAFDARRFRRVPASACCASGSGSRCRPSRPARSTEWASPESAELIKQLFVSRFPLNRQ